MFLCIVVELIEGAIARLVGGNLEGVEPFAVDGTVEIILRPHRRIVDADDDAERFATVLGNILVLSANESLVAAQMEAVSFFSPMPASLPLSDDSPLESKLGQLS